MASRRSYPANGFGLVRPWVEAPSNAEARASPQVQEVSSMPIDPVCGVQVDEEDAVTATYQGQTYYFCCEDCRDEFREAPDEYIGEAAESLPEEE